VTLDKMGSVHRWDNRVTVDITRAETARIGGGVEVTDGLEGFVEIVGHGSLTAAAQALGLPRSTLSRQLTRLEERMGVRLIHRSTRRIVLTRAGEELFTRAQRIVDEARIAVDAVRRHDDVPRGHLRVTAPPTYDEVLAEPILAFAAKYPEVSLELDATPRVVDLVAEGFDVALRGGAAAPQNHVRRVLFRSDAVAVASPAYLDRAGRPQEIGDLAGHTLIRAFDHGQAPETSWPLLPQGSVRVTGPIVTNDLVLRRTAALRGVGIAMLPIPSIRSAIHSGALEHVLGGRVGTEAHLALVYPERAFLQAKVRAFVDHLVAWAAALPPDPCVRAKRAAG
jgi:DNA-binding transcriptional LysR family regulator